MWSSDPLSSATLRFYADRDPVRWQILMGGNRRDLSSHMNPLKIVSLNEAIADIANVLSSGLEDVGVSTVEDANILTSPMLEAWRQQERNEKESVNAFIEAGRQIFTFDATLTKALADNDLGEIRSEDIRLSFEAFEIRLDGGLQLKSGLTDSAIVTRKNGNLKITLMSPSPWPSLVIGGSYDLADGQLNQEIENAVLKAAIDNRIHGDDIPSAILALKHVSAALLYLTCYRPDREEKYIGGLKTSPKEDSQNSTEISRLTTNPLSLEEITIRQSMLPEKGEANGYRPHMRRAHWRRQRHGPKLSLVSIKWIRPTQVGGKVRDIRQNTAKGRK